MIDEPELSLEARAQKVLKEIILENINNKCIIVATQSHIFLEKNVNSPHKNFLIYKNNKQTEIKEINKGEDLIDVTFKMLGNSLEDLFFPNNFLIVEGASDEKICKKVAALLGVTSLKLKIISARGVDNVQKSYNAISNMLIPVVMDSSPYKNKVVVLIDDCNAVNDKTISKIKSSLKDRCFLLDKESLEKYLPEKLYINAGREKEKDLLEIKSFKEQGNKKEVNRLKEEISDDIEKIITLEDLGSLEIICDVVRKGNV